MVTSPKTFCWLVSVLNFACTERLNFGESRCISSFVMATEIIILSGSHWKMKDLTTLILVKGKQLSAGESSKAFTFARTKSQCIAYTGSSRCSNCHF